MQYQKHLNIFDEFHILDIIQLFQHYIWPTKW